MATVKSANEAAKDTSLKAKASGAVKGIPGKVKAFGGKVKDIFKTNSCFSRTKAAPDAK